MAVIRVGVQAPAGSAGQTVDLDGPFATVSTIANLSAESIAYSVDGGGSWTTIAASGSASPGAAIASDRLRLRKVSSGAYPLAVDVTATLTGAEDNAAALQALVAPDGILAKLMGGDTSIRSGYYHLAYRGAQADFGPLLDQSGANHDAVPNTTALFPSAMGRSAPIALNAVYSPATPNGFVYECTTAGTTSASVVPLGTTVGGPTVDGTVTWTCRAGPWFVDSGGVRQFRSTDSTHWAGADKTGAFSLGVLPWDMAAGDSLILSITTLQNFTSGAHNFNETAVGGNRHNSGGGAGLQLVATGQTSYNDLRLRITDGTTIRNIAHLDSGGVATNRPGDGSRHTTTFFVDGRNKRMYLCADGVARSAANNYAGVSATDLVGWDADVSAVTGSTYNATTPMVFGGIPTNLGGLPTTSYEFSASRLDILVLPARGLPADIVSIAQWFHNRGEGLIPAGLVV